MKTNYKSDRYSFKQKSEAIIMLLAKNTIKAVKDKTKINESRLTSYRKLIGQIANRFQDKSEEDLTLLMNIAGQLYGIVMNVKEKWIEYIGNHLDSFRALMSNPIKLQEALEKAEVDIDCEVSLTEKVKEKLIDYTLPCFVEASRGVHLDAEASSEGSDKIIGE